MTPPSQAILSRAQDGSGAMFDAIAARYDLLNRVLSLGIDQRWRKATALALELKDGARVLDLATGTGDLAVMVSKLAPTSRITGVDPSTRMLEVGREKIARLGLADRIELLEGDAQALPFEDNSFDGVCIAFGIRNVPDRPKALREMARVTRPGGHVAILELSEPEGGILAPIARFHVHTMVPVIGAWISGAHEYRYLQRSIAAFPPARVFASQMQECGLEMVRVSPLTFGVCHLYVGRATS